MCSCGLQENYPQQVIIKSFHTTLNKNLLWYVIFVLLVKYWIWEYNKEIPCFVVYILVLGCKWRQMCRITRLQLQTDFLFRGAAVFPSWFSDYRMEIWQTVVHWNLYRQTFIWPHHRRYFYSSRIIQNSLMLVFVSAWSFLVCVFFVLCTLHSIAQHFP